MNQTRDDTIRAEDDVLFDKIEDNALERAAIPAAAAFTLGNCTGLESCPA
jgi:hypothetical protein